MRKIYIYSKDNLQVIGIPAVTSVEEFSEKPTLFYPDYNNKNMMFSTVKYTNPVLENNIIREETREEQILKGKMELLVDGELIENNKLISIDIPKDLFIPKWNQEISKWEEDSTLEKIESLLKKQLIEKNRENNAYTVSNFRNLELENEIKILEKKHADISMELCFEEMM